MSKKSFGYQAIARLFILKHMNETGETARRLARVIGCAESSFYAKMNGLRNFTADELSQLAAYGVVLPRLGSVEAPKPPRPPSEVKVLAVIDEVQGLSK